MGRASTFHSRSSSGRVVSGQDDPKQGRRQERELQVGDVVNVEFGGHVFVGTVVEDRDNIGVGGRRILRVRVAIDAYEPLTFEIPAEKLVPAA